MRIHLVKKSRVEYRCSKCGLQILVGSSYRWWKHRGMGKTRWHAVHGVPGPKDLTTSDKLSRLYSAEDAVSSAANSLASCSLDRVNYDNLVAQIEEMENIGDYDETELNDLKHDLEEEIGNLQDEAVGYVNDLTAEMTSCADEAEQVAEEYEESADNVEEYFGETEQVSEMRDKVEAINEWVNFLREKVEEFEGEDFKDYKLPEEIEEKMEEFSGSATDESLNI